MTFKFPAYIKSDVSGYNVMVDFYNFSKKAILEDIILDFSNNIWFEANLTAALGAVLSLLKENLCDIKIENLSPSVKAILAKNLFLSHFGGEKLTDTYSTTIKFRKFEVTEDKQFKEYLDNELLSWPDLPKMSPLLKKKINKSIFEIFNNAHIHGGCKYVFSCGQYYPQKKKLDFTIADLGITIRQNVNRYLDKTVSGKDAISWAVQEGNTTKTGKIPGGLGLSLIRDFLKLNQGCIQIVSSDGFWQEEKGTIFASDYSKRFIGTIVNLEFNINDKHTYSLSSEIDPEDIF